MNNNPQGILSSDRVGTRNNILQPHDIAIGHFGKKQFPKRSDKWALPFGAKVIVWPKGESAFMGTVSDVEAFNKKHPKKQALVIGLIFGIRKKQEEYNDKRRNYY